MIHSYVRTHTVTGVILGVAWQTGTFMEVGKLLECALRVIRTRVELTSWNKDHRNNEDILRKS